MSDFYNKYPYTDFHELNLDWVIERVKKLTEEWLDTKQAWENTEADWQELHDYVMNYFADLDVQDEIDNKLTEMYNDGLLTQIIYEYFGYVTPQMFGAKGDGATDDHDAMQTAIDYCEANKVPLGVPSGTYMIDGKLTITRKSSIFGIGEVMFDFSRYNTADALITINDSEGFDSYYRTIIDNIGFIGYHGSFPMRPENYSPATLFELNISQIILHNVRCYYFNRVFTYGSHTFLIRVTDSYFRANNKVIEFNLDNVTDSGENLSFTNCCIGNNNVVIDNRFGYFHFIGCSIDYNGIIVSQNVCIHGGDAIDGFIHFNNCHIEYNYENTGYVNAGGVITFSQCEVIGKGENSFDNTNGFLTIDSSSIRTDYFVTGNIPQVVGSWHRKYTGAMIHRKLTLFDNTFRSFSAYDSATISTAPGDYTDFKELIITDTGSPAYKTGYALSNPVDVKNRNQLLLSFDYKSDTAGLNQYCYIYQYDYDDQYITGATMPLTMTTDYKTENKTYNVPYGVGKIRLRFGCAEGQTVYIKNVYAQLT